jgi:hypothetical protein
VPGVARVAREGSGFVLEGAGDADAARAVGEAVHRYGWSILELRQETLDLEDIFLRLVESEERSA